MSTEQLQYLDFELHSCKYREDNPPPCKPETDYKGMITLGVFSFSLGILASLFLKR